MAKNRPAKQGERIGCGLGILPCEDSASLTVKVWCDPGFLCRDTGVLYLCLTCAEKLAEHAAGFGYEVIVDEE